MVISLVIMLLQMESLLDHKIENDIHIVSGRDEFIKDIKVESPDCDSAFDLMFEKLKERLNDDQKVVTKHNRRFIWEKAKRDCGKKRTRRKTNSKL